LVFRAIFPLVKTSLIKRLHMNEESFKRGKENVFRHFGQLGKILKGKKYLVGDEATHLDVYLAVNVGLATFCPE